MIKLRPANGSEDSTNVLWKALGPCTLGLDLTFNESMGFEQVGFPSVSPQDPTVKLVLTNDTELTLSGNPGGDTDWPYIFKIDKDTWHGTVELDAAAAAQSAGDIRLRISGTVDMAGDTLDWDLSTPGAQSYEYPLTMPGFRPHPDDPDAGVIRNTTASGDSTWPLGWAGLLVNARGFHTEASDPLSIQDMKIWIRDMDADTTLVNGISMTQYDRDFKYAWGTENDPYWDGRREVTVKAYNLISQILTDFTRNIVIDNSPPIAQKVELRNIWPGDTGSDTTIIRKAEWIDHPTDPALRQLEIETQRSMTLDTLEIVVQFDQTQDRDSLEVKTSYMVPGGLSPLFNEVRWDSTISPDDTWVGRCAIVMSSGMRDTYPGRWIVTIKSADLAGNSIDAKAETKAYRDSLGSFVGYEDTGADSTHSWWLQSWFDINIAGDVSQSLILGWNAQGMYVADRILELAQIEHSDSSRADLWRASVWRFFGSTTADIGIVEQLADVGGTLTQARSALAGLWAGASGWMMCSEQSAVIESLMAYGSKGKPRNYVLISDTQMNRGPSRREQTAIWAAAASDSTHGCPTHLYTVMPEEYAAISGELGDIVARSGGMNAMAPSDSMYWRSTVGRVLFNLIRDNSRLYMAQAESARGIREDHWFHIDELETSIRWIKSLRS